MTIARYLSFTPKKSSHFFGRSSWPRRFLRHAASVATSSSQHFMYAAKGSEELVCQTCCYSRSSIRRPGIMSSRLLAISPRPGIESKNDICTVRDVLADKGLQFEEMNRAIKANGINPVVVSTLDQIKEFSRSCVSSEDCHSDPQAVWFWMHLYCQSLDPHRRGTAVRVVSWSWRELARCRTTAFISCFT